MADIFVSSESERLVQLEIENIDKQIYARTAIPNTDKKLIIKIDPYNNNCLLYILTILNILMNYSPQSIRQKKMNQKRFSSKRFKVK